jgi:predicted Zn-dependent peptidase
MDVLADMLHHSLLEPGEIDRERSVVQQEIRRTQDQPSAFVGELLGRAFYGDHQMGWPTAGTEETVGALQQEDFLDWMDTWYGAPNVVLSVAGNTTHERVMDLAGRLFENGRPAKAPPMPPLEGELPDSRLITEGRPITQSNLAIALPGVGRKDPDRYVLMILNAVLGRGMSSRLFREVRERRGLAYSVGSSVSRHSDNGMLAVSAGVSPENVVEALSVILEQIELMAREPVGAEELQKGVDYTVGSFRLSLESTMALGQRAGESLLMMGEIEPVEKVVERLRAVTADDVLRVAQKLLRRDRATVALVGPEPDEAELARVLAV